MTLPDLVMLAPLINNTAQIRQVIMMLRPEHSAVPTHLYLLCARQSDSPGPPRWGYRCVQKPEPMQRKYLAS